MQVSKRQFLKLGLGGAAAWMLGPLLRPVNLFGSPLVTPPSYFSSSVYSYWMRLSYNGGVESRQVRRAVGAALRNVGAIKGRHGGFDFTLSFDRAVRAAFVRWAGSRQKPNSLFGLIAMLHANYIYPEIGPDGGRALFGILLGMLRGWEGTARGLEAHQAYLTYRDLALRYKDAGRASQDPVLIEQLRQERQAALANWRTLLLALAGDYAAGQMQLNPQFVIQNPMIAGFDVYVPPNPAAPPRLRLEPFGDQVIVRWKGGGQLQQAGTVSGPWVNARQAPPAAFDAKAPRMFFRTINSTSGLP
jgi:hypothetical protein